MRPIPVSPPIPGWPKDLTAAGWPDMRRDIRNRLLEFLGPFPGEIPAPRLKRFEEEAFETYTRTRISFRSEPDDEVTAWLLTPRETSGAVPAILTLHSSTRGAGKDSVVGICGRRHEEPPKRNMAYAIDVVEAGFVALVPDVCADGERTPRGCKPRDTRPFYRKHPDWSYMGKIIWDNMRAIDVLCSLPEVDAGRIGVIGHSLGGHSSIFTAGFDERIGAVVANGAVSYWVGPVNGTSHPQHWALTPADGVNVYMEKLRPFLTYEKWRQIPVAWYEIMSLFAPVPFLNMQAELDERPVEAENHGGVLALYRMLGCEDRVRFLNYPGKHDFPEYARKEAIQWFNRWFDAR